MIYIQSFIHIFAFFISHISLYTFTYHILMSYSILVLYPCLCMFHTYNLHRHMQPYTFLSYHGSFKVIYIFCIYLIPVTSYILLTYIFMYFISLSYLMTYTYTFLYLYVLLVLYQTVLSHVGVQNIDFFFNTLRYPSCPHYLPFIISYSDTHV